MTYEELLTFTGPQPLWTVSRLAEMLDVSTDFIYQAVQRDEIPHIRLGTNIRFHYKDILVWVAKHRIVPRRQEERMAFKRKDSAFYWISYVNHLGKRIRESTGTTKKAKAEMIERARRDQYAFRRRAMVDPEVGYATTFGELIDWWWKNYGCHLKSPTIKGSIEQHLRPALGDLPLSSFTGLALEQLLQSKATVLKPRSRNHLRAILRRMLRVGTRGGLWVGVKPVDDVAIAEVPKTVASFLAIDEVGPFLAACHGQYRQLFATALFTGMREGELFGLRKQDVN